MWKQEWNELCEKDDDDDENNDNVDTRKKEQKLKKRFVRNMASVVKKKFDKDSGQPIYNEIFLTVTDKVYNTYPPKNNHTKEHEWTELEHKLLNLEIKEDKIHKHIIPLYDSLGVLVDQHDALLRNNDEIAIKIRFKKRDVKGYGLSLKPIWIQLVKEGKDSVKSSDHFQNDGPINYGELGTPYKRKRIERTKYSA